jgi:sialidase-1
MAAVLFAAGSLQAAHVRLFILTGQSNSLGTTNGVEADPSPGSDPADARVRFFWHNVADAATSLGSSGGAFTGLQAQQGNYYAGSSTHWGPEIAFGRTLVRAGVTDIGIVKACRGGGGNTEWSKSAGGHMYDHLVATVNTAAAALTAAGDTFEIAGLLYLQGESDSAAEADLAGARFEELLNNLRADLPHAANLKAVIAGIAAPGGARDTVRARHEALAAGSASIDHFPNLDLRPAVTDGLHFDKAAKLRIGERFAQAFLANGTVARRYGRLVFIGDSITQGGNGDHPSYRYRVFQRLAEQGVPVDPLLGYQFAGSVTGPQTTPLLTTPDVNGQVFENVHDGHYGWRASWVSARVRLPANRRSNNRGEGTLRNWTGQAQPQTYDISGPDATVAYPDPAASGTGNTGATYVPDTAVMMIGINDLGDDPQSATQVVADLGTIVDQLRGANPAVRIFISQLLHTDQTQAMRDAVDAVNSQLPALAAAKNAASATSPVWIIAANEGFQPASMTYDAVHPNAVGEHHVGDRIAAALGVIESPAAPASTLSEEKASSDFSSRFEGHEIWDGSGPVNGWSVFGDLVESLPEATDLRLIHPSTNGRWLEGGGTGWSALANGPWTFEVRLKCNANANGFVLWFGTGAQRIIVEVHGNRTQDLGGTAFNVAHDNVDVNFHVFRVVHDPAGACYHVFRDGERLTPLAGAEYDQSGADSRLILGDYTSGVFGNAFDITIDHLRFGPGAWLSPGVDSDLNGMSDAWEFRHFATLTGTDPGGDPDGDGFSNLQEFGAGTDPGVADPAVVSLPVFLLGGGGNARGFPLSTPLNSPAPGAHPAEQAGGVWFHDGSGWSTLAAAADGSFGPEIGFARCLWDAGLRHFGIVKATAAGGGNGLWQKGGSAYDGLLATATAAAADPPPGFDRVNFTALLQVQGEGNDASEAAAADTRFATLLDDLKADLPDAANLRGILGEIGGSGVDRDTTRSRHASLAASRADIGLARSTGAGLHNLDGLAQHYTADSLFLLGARLAAETFDLGLAGEAPMPAWDRLHAWFTADSGVAFDSASAVSRWANLRNGSATRDLGRRVAGLTFRRTVSAVGGQARKVMRFDGSNDLWSNSSTEFGTLTGPRSVAVLCRVTGSADGFLFDGSTGSGRTRAQVRGGLWQAGAATTADPWNGPEPGSVPRVAGTWQQHVFTYAPDGNGGSSIVHWIDGVAAASFSDSVTSPLGGLIVGANGGSPFTRLAVEIAEVAVYRSALTGGEVAQLKSAWDSRWGSPTGPPFDVTVRQTPREIPRFGRHGLLELSIDSESAGTTTLEQVRIVLSPGSRAAIAAVLLVDAGDGSELGRIDAPAADELVFTPAFPLPEGTRVLQLAVVPARHAPLGSGIDAAVAGLEFSGGTSGEIVPATADPAGQLTLGLIPHFTDVVRGGDFGVNTFRIPGITVDARGVMHAVYDHRYNGGGDLPGNIDVGYSRSTDGGATWSASRVIMDFDASVSGSSGNGVGDPCILHDPVTDTLWVAALWSFGNRAYSGSGTGLSPSETGQYVLVKSSDGGETWSPPVNITAQVKDPAWRLLFCGPGHGLAMRDGTLVFPSQYRDGNGTVRSCSVYSADHGQTWAFGAGVPTSSPQTNENTVCELDDGRLLFSMRTPSGSNGQRAWIRYQPGGAVPMRDGSWGSLFRLPAVPDPVCQGSVIQWTSTHRGDPREFVLFGNPASASSRVDFTLRVSPDGGESWPVSRLLHAGSSAYSSLCILPDRSIGVLFEKDNYSRITFARVEEAWLMNPAVDADADGMPDAWESLYGLDPALADGAADPDGDGVPSALEYLAGTDPRDGASALRITAASRAALAWQSVPGRAYAVEKSGDLAGWTTVTGLDAVTATGAESSVALPEDEAPASFFRIRVLP